MQRKTSFFSCFFVVLWLILVSCASMQVTVNYDETASFASYKTFFLLPPKHAQDRPGSVRSPIFTREVMREIRPILERRGFSEAASENQADFLVVFYAMMRNRQDFVPPVYRVGRWGRTWVARPGRVVRYKEGTLAIDVVDRKKNDLIWQGVGKDVLDRNDPASNLVAAVEKVLEKFPPTK